MQVNELGLKNREQWECKGYSLPKFDRAAVTEKTMENPDDTVPHIQCLGNIGNVRSLHIIAQLQSHEIGRASCRERV